MGKYFNNRLSSIFSRLVTQAKAVTFFKFLTISVIKKMDKYDYIPITIPNYSYIFNFEKSFAYSDSVIRITNHYPYCFCYCLFYIILIFAGRYFMSSRPKFELRGMLALWNTSLAVFSIFGFLRMGSELYHVLRHYGFQHSICIRQEISHLYLILAIKIVSIEQ